MTIDVYVYPASGPCRAVLMTVTYLGIEDVNVKVVDLLSKEQFKPDFLKMNPQHCVPTIDDSGFYLWESRAILTYLVNKYAPDSPLYPKDPQERAVVDRMLYFDACTLYKAEFDFLYPQLFKGEPADPRLEECLKKALALFEEYLSNSPYAAGDHITLADLSIIASLTFAQINPQKCIPTIDDGGFYLWESRAIQTYFANKYAPDSPLYPKDPQERAVVDRMLYFDAGTLYKAEFEYLYPQLFRGEPADPAKEEAFKKALTLYDEFLSATPYAAGDHITLADLSIIASLTFAELVDYSYDAYPNITAWIQKMKSEIPGFKEINEDPLNELKALLRSKN